MRSIFSSNLSGCAYQTHGPLANALAITGKIIVGRKAQQMSNPDSSGTFIACLTSKRQKHCCQPTWGNQRFTPEFYENVCCCRCELNPQRQLSGSSRGIEACVCRRLNSSRAGNHFMLQRSRCCAWILTRLQRSSTGCSGFRTLRI